MVYHKQATIGILVAAHIGLMTLSATTTPAHTGSQGSVETVALFDPDVARRPRVPTSVRGCPLSAALTALTGELRELARGEFVCADVVAPVHDPE